MVTVTRLAHTCMERCPCLLQVQVLLPAHPGLGRLLMSRKVAIKVLQDRTDFLTHIDEAGAQT